MRQKTFRKEYRTRREQYGGMFGTERLIIVLKIHLFITRGFDHHDQV